ncbi:hypothetical protein [Chryseobacterium polytrichastri]|uniref:Uncharacterized protein n=1 Tax=Chryseobacterium polytrichastri TaxID=1302687 RepID=A0A1M7HNZ8_9FLAO|nr:hypothetical protein [Chryseobacterium polytrichastri]SHM30150.1 hypothetical protein SAMN05444267_104137 [Chryseobacterium polytrichastri]
MRVKYKLFFILFFLNIIYISSQKKDVEIKKDSLKYNVSGKNIIYKRIIIKNNSKERMIFWITKNKECPQEYFGIKGDFSLKELLTEDSLENFNTYPIIFLDFIKILKPQEDFYLLYNDRNEPFLNIYKERELPMDILSAIKYAAKNYEERFYPQNMIFLPDL